MEKPYIVFLIPQNGLPVRDPNTKVILLEAGETKSLTGKAGRYWRRRLIDGSVKIGKPEMAQIIRRKKLKEE